MIWEPRPLRNFHNLPENTEEYRVKKSITPIERQRKLDGTPITISGRSNLKPKEPSIIIKGSLAEKLPPATYKTDTDPPQFCEHSFSELVKSYLNS
jgi:hypothetical protein